MSASSRYSKFQLKIITVFEDEVIERLHREGSKLNSEEDVLFIVDQVFEELYDVQTSMENGSIEVITRPEDITLH